jgi:hypothetical protein
MTMLNKDKITEIFYIVDEFCKEYNKTVAKFSLSEADPDKKHRNKPCRLSLSDSEVSTILILLH